MSDKESITSCDWDTMSSVSASGDTDAQVHNHILVVKDDRDSHFEKMMSMVAEHTKSSKKIDEAVEKQDKMDRRLSNVLKLVGVVTGVSVISFLLYMGTLSEIDDEVRLLRRDSRSLRDEVRTLRLTRQ